MIQDRKANEAYSAEEQVREPNLRFRLDEDVPERTQESSRDQAQRDFDLPAAHK